MPFFAVWRNRMQGGGSWIEVSMGYGSRTEAEAVRPEREGIPETNPRTLILEATTDAEVRSLYTQWEARGSPRPPR